MHDFCDAIKVQIMAAFAARFCNTYLFNHNLRLTALTASTRLAAFLRTNSGMIINQNKRLAILVISNFSKES